MVKIKQLLCAAFTTGYIIGSGTWVGEGAPRQIFIAAGVEYSGYNIDRGYTMACFTGKSVVVAGRCFVVQRHCASRRADTKTRVVSCRS